MTIFKLFLLIGGAVNRAALDRSRDIFYIARRGFLWCRRSGFPRLSGVPGHSGHEAQVAQLVEQRTENPRVGGSNPPLGTIFLF